MPRLDQDLGAQRDLVTKTKHERDEHRRDRRVRGGAPEDSSRAPNSQPVGDRNWFEGLKSPERLPVASVDRCVLKVTARATQARVRLPEAADRHHELRTPHERLQGTATELLGHGAMAGTGGPHQGAKGRAT